MTVITYVSSQEGGPCSPSRSSVPLRRCPFVVQERPGELGPGGDAEFAENLAQVVFDGAGADEQPGGDLPVRQVPGDQPGDLRLLRGKHSWSVGAARAGPLSGGAQFGPGPARERL